MLASVNTASLRTKRRCRRLAEGLSVGDTKAMLLARAVEYENVSSRTQNRGDREHASDQALPAVLALLIAGCGALQQSPKQDGMARATSFDGSCKLNP
jgi:hypothetical protein